MCRITPLVTLDEMVASARLEAYLRDTALRVPEKVALVCGDARVTYDEMYRRANARARALRAAGVGVGDRVLVMMSNSVDAAVAFWSILIAGAVAVPLHSSTKADRVRWIAEHCSAAAVIGDPGDLDTDAAVQGHPMPEIEGTGDELAALIYTSGSTGSAKGVMLSHRNMTAAASSVCEYLTLREDDVIHGIMPMSFDYGLYQLVMAVRQGARLVLAPAFTLPGQVLKQAAAERVTFFPGVPTVFAMLGQLERFSAWDLSSVRAVTSTAATLTERHIEIIKRVFPNAAIFSMYGLTECKRCTYLPPADLERKPGSVGIAIPGTELWLVDEADQRLGPNRVGQLVIRGPTVMRGYWGDPAETARALRPGPGGELVLYTGDLCRLDDDGYLYFVGRTDDIIKSRGEKVAPKEVELVLSRIAGVREAAVIGIADELLGEALRGFVVLEAGVSLSESELLRACRDQLETFKVPRAITVVASLPKNANGKIDKVALRGDRCDI